MLNIEDIRKRRKDNPEPKEVEEIRQIIKDKFSNVTFKEDTHQYFLPDGRELKPVSNFVATFEHPFDTQLRAEHTSVKEGIPVKDVLRKWREINITATNSGTAIHLFAENYCYFFLDQLEKLSPIIKPQYEEGYLIPMCPKQQAAAKVFEDIFHEKDLFPVMPETQVYLDPVYSGTFDLLWYYRSRINPKKSGVLVLDWKTNSNIFNDYIRNTGTMMLEPFSEYYDEALSHYYVQLNCYSIPLMLEGINVLARRVLWLHNDGNYYKYNVPDISSKIIDYIAEQRYIDRNKLQISES